MYSSGNLETEFFSDFKLTKENLEKVKETTLILMKTIHKICVDNGLKYSLAFGTLLGAVRHKGFIPWDDDIDIVMTRADYEKLVKLIEKREDIYVVDNNIYKNYPRDFPKVELKGTILKHLFCGEKCDYPMGVFVDIFFLEYKSSNNLKAFIQNKKYRIYNLMASLSADYKYPSRQITERSKIYPQVKKYYKLRRFSGFFASIVPIRSWIKKASKVFAKNKPSDVFRTDLLEAELSAKDYKNIILYRFEDTEFYGIENYDGFLKSCYGDYMTIPKGADRISHCVTEFKID